MALISPDDAFAMAELASAATVWPVSLLSPGCSYFDTAFLPLSCSNDYVRFFPGRPVMLTWTAEEIVELGVGHRLESVDEASNRGMIIIYLARTFFKVGVRLVIPLERYWGPYARVPLPLHVNHSTDLTHPMILSAWFRFFFQDLFPLFEMCLIPQDCECSHTSDDDIWFGDQVSLSPFPFPIHGLASSFSDRSFMTPSPNTSIPIPQSIASTLPAVSRSFLVKDRPTAHRSPPPPPPPSQSSSSPAPAPVEHSHLRLRRGYQATRSPSRSRSLSGQSSSPPTRRLRSSRANGSGRSSALLGKFRSGAKD
ncbi:hypothetical protein BDY19DRAFT_991702 [Irpex rosettiformis]|uniref:Uncharacterized protein n=1 Tax=Irpex rosettiformis TaxID=378272 RepID=A0ACB8U9W5_9APHY|nr:hypothetical protein BDY19DRAFT_991702 [Irpex rosettiformis]